MDILCSRYHAGTPTATCTVWHVLAQAAGKLFVFVAQQPILINTVRSVSISTVIVTLRTDVVRSERAEKSEIEKILQDG